MNIQNFQPTARTEVEQAPAWLDRFLDPIYRQLELLTRAMQARLAVGENINGEITDPIKVFHDQDVDIGLQKTKGKARVVVAAELTTGNVDAMTVQYDMTWRILDEKHIRVRVKFAAGTTVTSAMLTLAVLGG